jgi:Dolichyl-phosphate-mannose-protein mannosyltransferase
MTEAAALPAPKRETLLRRLTPERLAVGFAALAGLIVLWNAAAYPVGAGYDAASHKEYADFLIDHLRLPHVNETPEYYSPPLYYGVAGALSWLGREAGLGEPHKLAQLWNVPVAVVTVLLVIALARVVAPGRRWVAPAAAGFVALSPVLTRTASMFNPEPTDLLVSVLCLYLAARILAGRRFGTGAALGLGVALGAGQMVRQFALWTLATVVLAFVAAIWWRPAERRATLRSLGLALAACALIAGPWYGYRAANYSNAIFDRPHVAKPLWERRPASFYVDPGLPDVFSRPYRPHMANLAWPQTYTDMWGDWYGVFAWKRAGGPPAPATDGWLVLQNIAGLVPTALAIVGWLWLLVRSLRRREPPRLLVGLLPLAGLAGYLYFTVSYPVPDGDVLKPTYMLSTLGAWAICFGWAVDRAAARAPKVVAAGLGVLALVDLPFVIYRGALGFF